MRSFLSSPIATSVSNIASVNIHKHSSFKTKKDYSDFITWLDASNNDIRKIKLPSKKKLKDLEDLDFSSMLGGGNPLAALLGEILGGLATSLGIPSLNNLPTFGKTTRTPSSTPASSGKMGGGIGGIPPISKINVKDITNKTKLLPSKPNLLPETKIKGLLPSSEFRAQTKLLPEKPKISQPGKGFASLHPDIAGQGDFGKRADKILEERRAARLAKDGTKAATKNITNEAEKKAAKFAGKNAFTRFFKAAAPGAGSVFSAMDAKDRADKGDKIGSWISGTSSALSGFAAVAQIPAAIGLTIPGIGWAETAATELVAASAEILSFGLDAVNLVRDLTGNSDGKKKEEKPKNKIDIRLKAQEKKQKEAASASNVTFVSITDKFDKVVSKFEKIAGGMGAAPGKQPSNASTEDKMTEYGEYGERDQSTSTTPGELQDLESTGGVLPSSSSKGDKFGYSSWRGRNHNGIDYPLPEGTPISVIQPGTVADAGFRDNGYGNQVKVNHPGGVSSFYAHLSSINVSSGQKIDPGTVIGKIGTTGSSTGPHLHFEVDVNGKVSNPEPYEDILFRFGGNVKVKAKKGENQVSQGMADIRGSAPDTKQQSIEDFAKQTMGKGADKILKDPKLKAQLLGEKHQFKNAMVKTPVTDPGIKQLQENYNVYVKGLRERRQAKAVATRPEIPQALMEDSLAAGSTTMVLQQPSVAPAGGAGQTRIIPVPVGGGGNGGSDYSGPSEGQIVNSLLKAFLLTNLSGT